jgi:hypothetical protein
MVLVRVFNPDIIHHARRLHVHLRPILRRRLRE